MVQYSFALRIVAALVGCLVVLTSADQCTQDPNHKSLHVVGFSTIAEKGNFVVEGRWHIQGYQVWAARTNELGGIWSNGTRYCVNLTVVNVGQNTSTHPTTFARQVAQAWVNGTNGPVDFFLAPFSSTMTLPVALETESSKKLMLSASASSTVVYQCKGPLMAAGSQPDCVAKGAVDLNRRFEYLFGFQPPAENVVQPVITLFKLKNVKTMVVWFEEQPYTRSIAMGSVTMAPFVGINITKMFIVPANPKFEDVDKIMDEVVAQNADAVVGGTYYDACRHFIAGCHSRNWFPKALFMSLCSGDARATLPLESAGLGSDGKWTLDYFEWDSRLRGPDYEDFLLFPKTAEKPSPALFREYFVNFHNGSEPAHFAAISAGLGVVFHTMMNRTGQGVDNETFRRLLGQTVLTTFIGKIGFNGWGQNNAREVVIVQPDRNNVLQLIYPLGSSSAEFVYPIPALNQRTFTYNYMGTPVEIAFAVITSILIAFSIALLIVIFVYRENKVIFASAPVFLMLILAGSIIIYCTVYAWQIHTSKAACILRFWFLGLGFVLMFGALFSKTYRVARIFRQSKLVVLKITNKDVGILLAILVVIELAILIVWTAVANPDATTIVLDADRPALNQMACTWTTGDMALLIVGCIYKGAMIIAGITMSVMIWKIPLKTFNEAKQIGFSMYNMFFFLVIAFGLQASGIIAQEAMFVIRSLCILLSTVITVATIFIPKIIAMQNPVHESSFSTNRTMTNSVLGSKTGSKMTMSSTNTSTNSDDTESRYADLNKKFQTMEKQFNELKGMYEAATGQKYTPGASRAAAQKPKKKAVEDSEEETEPSHSEEDHHQEIKKKPTPKEQPKKETAKTSAKKSSAKKSPKAKKAKAAEPVVVEPEVSTSSSSSSEEKKAKKLTDKKPAEKEESSSSEEESS